MRIRSCLKRSLWLLLSEDSGLVFAYEITVGDLHQSQKRLRESPQGSLASLPEPACCWMSPRAISNQRASSIRLSCTAVRTVNTFETNQRLRPNKANAVSSNQ